MDAGFGLNELGTFLEAHEGELSVKRSGSTSDSWSNVTIRVWRDGKPIERFCGIPDRDRREASIPGSVFAATIESMIRLLEHEHPALRVR